MNMEKVTLTYYKGKKKLLIVRWGVRDEGVEYVGTPKIEGRVKRVNFNILILKMEKKLVELKGKEFIFFW